jgi:hypothetical protein
MDNFDITIALNREQLPANVHPHAEGETTFYDVRFENYTLTIFKDTMFTWASEDPHGLSNADIQSIGAQLEDRE